MPTRALPRSRYLDRPYRIVLTRNGRGPNADWKATVDEFVGCEARGATMEEAAAAVRDAMDAWISDALANGRRIPPPQGAARERGPIQVEAPPSLMMALSRGAVREGLDLNTFVATVLAAAVGWRPAEDEPDAVWLHRRADVFASDEHRPTGRLLRLTALSTMVLTVLAVIAALVLLIVALKHA